VRGLREQLTRLFELLGFRAVAVVGKKRSEYHLDYEGRPMVVALDLADGLGTFAEVETLVEAESDLHEGQKAVLALAGDLGLSEVEPRSYLRMVLEATSGRLSRNPAGQT
jgi:adenylate cyclase class 2